MEDPSKSTKVLPPNAFRELKPGEVYTPVVPGDQSPPEVSVRSVAIGVIMVVIFTFAAAYIGLKTGNVIETSIPIAILAVFLGTLFARRNTLLELSRLEPSPLEIDESLEQLRGVAGATVTTEPFAGDVVYFNSAATWTESSGEVVLAVAPGVTHQHLGRRKRSGPVALRRRADRRGWLVDDPQRGRLGRAVAR